jgi:hypothetical protein
VSGQTVLCGLTDVGDQFDDAGARDMIRDQPARE